jgi:4-hydroxybenzoate polyprenyltransferase
MKLTIPEEWILGRWWQNRILWCLWFLGALVLGVKWFQRRGPLAPYIIAYTTGSTAAAIGFALGDWTNRRRDAAHRYRLPGEK